MSCRRNQQVGCGDGDPAGTATLRKCPCLLPDRPIHGVDPKRITKAAQLRPLFFTARAIPKFQDNHIAEHGLAGRQQLGHSAPNFLIPIRAKRVNPGRCINERHDSPRWETSVPWSTKFENVPRISTSSAER